MRYHDKCRYQEGLKTLRELCFKLNEIGDNSIYDILLECQEYVIALGCKLERVCKEEDLVQILPSLENCAELIYRFSEKGILDDGVENLCKRIQTIMLLLDEIPCRNNIIFLPYKASMWDAFDSVYKMAVKDSNANVIVMPIPYRSYDKRSDCWHEHYEGMDFPTDIQITDYHECRLAEIKADYIFIHNPYDQYNYVTRVHEDYFSSVLKEYTDHLIYIPYDVVLGTKIDKNYCLMPGVQNAWKVVVQSEDIREEYIKWVDPNRVVALGSPKIDAIVNYDVTLEKIPDTWKVKCQDKKVFLYNTHLNGIIADGYLLIKRLQKILDFFSHHQEITLLWRPHPLSVQTAEAMNPNFLHSYLEMVRKFKMLDNCIYDDSSDLDRAIGISDAYMGDFSSLVMLYGFTGKPIYLHSIQNRDMCEEERNRLLCLRGTVKDGIMWAPHDLFNGLFCVDIETGKIEFISALEQTNWNQEDAFLETIFYQGRLYLIPNTADYIVEYDINTQEQRTLKINNKSSSTMNFSTVVQKDNQLFLFPLMRPNPVLVFNMDQFQIERIDLDYQTIGKFCEVGTGFLFGENGVVIGNKIWISFKGIPMLASFEDGEFEYYSVMEGSVGIRSIAYYDSDFYLVINRSTTVVVWNLTEGIKDIIEVPDDVLGGKNGFIQKVTVADEYIWIVPSRGTNIVKYIRKEKRYKLIINIMEYSNHFAEYDNHLDGICEDEKYIYVFPYRMEWLIIINKCDDSFRLIKMDLPPLLNREDYLLSLKKDREREGLLDYRETFLLDTEIEFQTFVDYVKNCDGDEEKEKKVFGRYVANADGSAGEKIYSTLINEKTN